MPDGVIQWLDTRAGEARLVSHGRIYPASLSELEVAARTTGVRVHFDIRREAGIETAVHVTARPGDRGSRRHARAGTLAGARRPDTKGTAPFAKAHIDLGLSLASHPVEVARAWASCIQEGRVDDALLLYAPAAVIHHEGGDVYGDSGLHAYLTESLLLGPEHEPRIRSEDGVVVVSWHEEGPDQPGTEVRSRIEHGVIVEQWVQEAPARAEAREVEGAPVAVTAGPGVEEEDVAYALARFGAFLKQVGPPVLFARLRLTLMGDPARVRPAIIQAAVDIDGQPLRAHIAGHDMHEAADLLERRLHDKLRHRADRMEHLRTWSGEVEPGEWRRGDFIATRPAYFDRPVAERALVRHKSFALDELTIDEAAFDMGQLDYEFHLFRDAASGEESVLSRDDDGYVLTRLHSSAAELGPCAVNVRVSDQLPPVLSVAEAVSRLDAGGEPFVFFANRTTGRANVAYRRYDGHYGLITGAA